VKKQVIKLDLKHGRNIITGKLYFDLKVLR